MKKIMVVDDEYDQLISIKTSIEDFYPDEYQIITAKGGAECFSLLKNDEIPDLILLDIMMPEMTGWEVFEKLKNYPKWKDIPIVFLTARTDRVAKDAGGFLGEDYIEKPFKVPDLKERIDKILKKD